METRSEDLLIPIEFEGDWVIEEGLKLADKVQSKASETIIVQPRAVIFSYPIVMPTNSGLVHTSGVDVFVTVPEFGVPNIPKRDRIFGQAGYEQLNMDRIGEMTAHKYFGRDDNTQVGLVSWANSETEMGLLYDLVVRDTEESRQFIEVNSTRYSSKGWFEMSVREWQFASECGDSFSITHVALL